MPFYRPEAVIYSKVSLLARQMELAILGTFHERQGDQYLVEDSGSAWVRLIGNGISQHFNGPLAPSFNGTFAGIQLGSDAWVSDEHRDRVGLFGSYMRANGEVRGTILDVAYQLGGYLPTDAYNVGAYYTHIADQGWYVDAVAMGTWFNSYPKSLRGIGTRVTGQGVTASAEGAYPFRLDQNFTLEPMAQIIFTTNSFGPASDPYSTMDFHAADAWYGRIGARLEDATMLGGSPVVPYLEANLWHGFGGTDTTVYNGSIPVPLAFGNTDFEAATGITTKASDDISLIARVSYTINISGQYQQVLAGQMGVRYVW